jgi:hypothetical protein
MRLIAAEEDEEVAEEEDEGVERAVVVVVVRTCLGILASCGLVSRCRVEFKVWFEVEGLEGALVGSPHGEGRVE